jgi:hypothetical protein
VQEIAPGIFHWSAYHPGIRTQVSSYYVEPANAVIDPMLPDDGLEWFEERGARPAQVLLTNRHHYRRSDKFVEAFGSEVRASRPGMHEFESGPPVCPFDFGDEVAPGIEALEVGAICPDETALLLRDAGALVIADGIIRYSDELQFVPDSLLGDDPEGVKRGLRDAYSRLLDRDFDNLLFAHGRPLIGGGKEALREFCG